MSNLFLLSNTEQEQSLTLKDENDLDLITQVLSVGEKLEVSINNIELSILDNKKSGKKVSLADFPNFFSGALLANKNTKEILEPYINNCGEWVEMTYEKTKYYFFNVTKQLDVLDEDKTDFWVVDGFTIGINKFAFKKFDSTNYPIFKLSYDPKHSAIVTNEFVSFIEENKLSGLSFIKI